MKNKLSYRQKYVQSLNIKYSFLEKFIDENFINSYAKFKWSKRHVPYLKIIINGYEFSLCYFKLENCWKLFNNNTNEKEDIIIFNNALKAINYLYNNYQ